MLKPTKIFGELRNAGIWTSYLIFQITKNKGVDQTARMRRLVRAFVDCNQQKS